MHSEIQEHGPRLVGLARRAIVAAVNGASFEVNPEEMPPALQEWRGCFVTLTAGGRLRGCVGQVYPQEPAYQAVIISARNAALHDPRFPPVSAGELPGLRIEVSVLGSLQPLAFGSTAELLRGICGQGVVLRIGNRTATFLPQVWAHFPDPEEFLDRLAQKAGCEVGAWREEEISVWFYSVEKFEEP